jgi:hypothetical protein
MRIVRLWITFVLLIAGPFVGGRSRIALADQTSISTTGTTAARDLA